MKPPLQRSTLHVDLGAQLSAGLRTAAAAIDRTPSQWTRELIQRQLNAAASSPAPKPGQATGDKPARKARVGHMDLDAELASMLDEVTAQGHFRSRPAALRLVLRQFLGKGQAVAVPIDAAPLKDAVAALMRSNHELVPIGTNLNQIAKQLNALQGVFKTADAKQLTVFVGEVRGHVDKAARLAADLGALLTPHKR
jgi:hypothetical protein